jgi:hypothetical protein
MALVMMISSTTGVTVAGAQARLFDVHGEVKDEHGDVIVGAIVSLVVAQGLTRAVVTDGQGRFRFSGLVGGSYKLNVSADGFSAHERTLDVSEKTSAQPLTITLYPKIVETVSVEDTNGSVALDPNQAAGAKVLKEKELAALSHDPDQFKEELELLSTSSGSSPGQATVTVDGFLHSGRLPPKSAIREVRINPDLFSAEYDKPPYRGGRIEIYTKPGAGSLHGSGFFNVNDSVLNARHPFAPSRAPSTTHRYGFQLGGPIIPKKAGYFLDFEARRINEFATVHAVTLDRDFQPATFAANVPTPNRLGIGSARGDWQLNSSHTFIARYDFNDQRLGNQGVGGFNLPDRAYNNETVSHSLRLSETAILSTSILNEARWGLTFQRVAQQASSNAPAISVLGAFSSGGAGSQALRQEEWRMELTDNLIISHGKHSLKLGAQIFGKRLDDARADNFNGTFVFGGGVAPELDASGMIVPGTSLINISGLEQYRRTLLGLPGGVPTRFSIARGNPAVTLSQWTFAGFAQDEWRLRPDVLLSLGLRYEAQTAPSDAFSLAPRIGIAYSPDSQRRWVVRARAGLFYDRINESLVGETLRLDGRRQEQIIIDSPSFPDPFKSGTARDVVPTLRRIDPTLRPPASLQTQLGFERQLPRGWKLEASYYWSWGWAALRSRNINAPFVASGADPLQAPRPLGLQENVLQFESSGRIEGTVLFVGVNQTVNKFFNLYSGYLLFDFRTNADMPFIQPQSSYSLEGEWARPFWQARHRTFIVGIFNLPFKLRASSIVNAASGTPFTITTGRDNNGDGNFNDRPSRVRAENPNAIVTSLGVFDPTVVNGALPRNTETGSPTATLDLNLSRVITLKKGASDDRLYQMTLTMNVGNVLNHTNRLGFSGVLASPLFGRANTASAPRRIEVGVRFSL